MTHKEYIRSLEESFRQDLKEIVVIQKESEEERKKWSKEWKERHAKWDKGMAELRASQRETDEQIKQTKREMEKTDKKLREFIGEFGHRWGKLGENLVKGALVEKLREKGVKKINRVVENAKKGDLEYDIIAVNGKEVVIVEVKATLRPPDVYKFMENIKKFKTHWPEYKDKVVYGSIAYLLKANKKAEKVAEEEGFFVVEAVGDVIIKNKKSFKPKVFA